MTVVLLGGGGLLGSGFRTVLEDHGRQVSWLRPPWHEPSRLPSSLQEQLRPLLLTGAPTALIWAAGTGSVGVSAEEMTAEEIGLRAVCEVVAGLPVGGGSRVSLLLASSAGALFAGRGSTELHETATPAPLSAYGHAKLGQEQLLQQLSASTGCRVVAARISNVYGLAQGRLTPRGLVSTAVRATRLRQPMTIFVNPDVRRDYVYNRDAAALCLQALAKSPEGFSTTLVRDGQTRAVSEVLGVVGRVAGRRVPAVYAERRETRLQPPVLRFRPPEGGPNAVRRTPFEVAVHRMLRAPLAA